ncbi:MAG: VWA domain-containing protein [Pyrinomonadaceae bacterium]
MTKNPACLLLTLSVCAAAIAQSTSNEKPKLKPFGSSLDRLKWDKEKQMAVETAEVGKSQTAEDDVIRVETQLISTDVLVLDKTGKPVTGLNRDSFVITEDGQPQEVGHFSLGSDVKVPKSIVLIIDYSRSEIPYIGKSVAAAKALVDHLGEADRMAIVTDDVDLLTGFTSDKAKLKDALHSLLGRISSGRIGKSEQFAALMASVRELFNREDIRPIVIFQTDGDEIGFLQPPNENGRILPKRVKPFSLADILLALDKARVTVYTVIPNVRLIGVPREELPDRTKDILKRAAPVFGFRNVEKTSQKDLLKYAEEAYLPQQQAAAKVATSTGGWTAFLELPEQADEIYERILADVNSRYVVGYYYPADRPRDGKRHQLSITIKDHPEYQIAGRKSYVAPGPGQ